MNETGSPINVQVVFSLAIPAISNLALGLEVFLKMHHFQNTGIYPTGHDIGALATSFEETVQQGLRHAYLMARETDLVQKAATLKMSIGEELSDLTATWPDDATDLDSAAKIIGRAYERWRYVYEELRTPLLATIAFKPLLAMVSTFDYAVRSFESEAYVSIGTNAA